MAQVPLNHFVRTSTLLGTTYTQVYSAPAQTASIMLTILATNLTNTTQTINIAVSGNGSPDLTTPTLPLYSLVNNFSIPANDVTNLAVGKIVIQNYDALYCYAGNASAVNLTCSILETLNTTS